STSKTECGDEEKIGANSKGWKGDDCMIVGRLWKGGGERHVAQRMGWRIDLLRDGCG
ncbi:hypothetical protein WUBG_04767, partial [Wuchereria bancrofti]